MPAVSFVHRWLCVRESNGSVNVCVQKDTNTTTNFNVIVETQSGTALGEEIEVDLLYSVAPAFWIKTYFW